MPRRKKKEEQEKSITIRIPANHPIFAIKNKKKYILEALEIKLAIDLYIKNGIILKFDSQQTQDKKVTKPRLKDELPVNINNKQVKNILNQFLENK